MGEMLSRLSSSTIGAAYELAARGKTESRPRGSPGCFFERRILHIADLLKKRSGENELLEIGSIRSTSENVYDKDYKQA